MKNIKSLLLLTVAVALPSHADILESSGDCGNVTINPDYDACAGFFKGNDSNQEDDVLDTLNAIWGPEWSALEKVETEDDGSLVKGTHFSLEGSDENETGKIDFLSDFDPYQLDFDVVVSFKAGNQFAFYYWDAAFDNESLAWDTETGVKTAGLSHATIWYRGAASVPEPGTLALLGAGLIGIGFARKSKKA